MSINILVNTLKGGVGKTAISVNLATTLAKMGKQVLFIDMDTQGDATRFLTQMEATSFIGKNIYDMFRGYQTRPLSQFVVDTQVQNLSIIPASRDTESIENRLRSLSVLSDVSKEEIFAGYLEELGRSYEYIIIDTPSAKGTIQRISMYSADYVIVPIKPDQLSLEAFRYTILSIKEAANSNGGKTKLLGVVLSMVDHTVLTREIRDMLQDNVKEKLFTTEIRKAQIVNESATERLPVVIYKPNSPSAEEFNNLAKEVIERIKNDKK